MDYPTFTESFVRIKAKPKVLKNPLLVIGLPGVGLVSKLAVDYLVKEYKAQKIATLYSPHFPNQVLAMASGRLRLFSIGFYVKRFKARDVVFVRGDLQPLTVEGQFEVSAKVLDFARQLGCTEVLAMAGYAVPDKRPKPSIYCACTDENFFKKLTAIGAKKAGKVIPIVGMAGLLPSLSKLYSMKGCCLLVETPGTPMDPVGSKTLLDFLSKMVGQKFDYKALDERVKKAEVAFKKFEKQHAGSPTLQPPAIPEAVEKDTLRYIR